MLKFGEDQEVVDILFPAFLSCLGFNFLDFKWTLQEFKPLGSDFASEEWLVKGDLVKEVERDRSLSNGKGGPLVKVWIVKGFREPHENRL
jgi:hypothetical protein